ncbi:Transcription factor Sp8 [Cytospora mali]|uniref:Transcription factor Sp8 n=1 Tax=Cytospora mali TaxID=578113 RepID=A0A194VQ75_CYTMA|nr:Transcription factor Sp8 [Valsa mali]
MEPPVPTADPESMEAKKGLNKWGAFDSFSGSGTGTFGFGPLLFHHHVDETPRDPYDTGKLLLNDPISFNPLDAISWAKLDNDPASAATTKQAVGAPRGAGREKKAMDDEQSGYIVASPTSPTTGRIGSDVSKSRASSVAGSSVGNMSRTFSNTSLVSPETSMPQAQGPLRALPGPGPETELKGPEPELLLCLGPHCSARFRTEDGLNAHYQAEHSFKCNWVHCKALRFTSNNDLEWHIKTEHRFVCPIPGCCEMFYPNKKVLDAHLKGEPAAPLAPPPNPSVAGVPRNFQQQKQRRRSKSPSPSLGRRHPQKVRR